MQIFITGSHHISCATFLAMAGHHNTHAHMCVCAFVCLCQSWPQFYFVPLRPSEMFRPANLFRSPKVAHTHTHNNDEATTSSTSTKTTTQTTTFYPNRFAGPSELKDEPSIKCMRGPHDFGRVRSAPCLLSACYVCATHIRYECTRTINGHIYRVCVGVCGFVYWWGRTDEENSPLCGRVSI